MSKPNEPSPRTNYYRSRRQKMREQLRRWRALNPLAMSAQEAVKASLAKGTLIRKPCEVCGSEKSEAHHDDYTRPLDVLWLCRKHHKEKHPHNPEQQQYWSKLTADKVRKIRELAALGKFSQSRIGLMFGVDQATVSKIISRQSWANI